MNSSAIQSLTERELSVIEALLYHAGTTQVANRLGISVHTARRHIEHVMVKLGISSRHDIRQALGLDCDCAQRRMTEIRSQIARNGSPDGSTRMNSARVSRRSE